MKALRHLLPFGGFERRGEAVIAVAPDVLRVGPCGSTLVSGLPVEYTYQVHSIRDPAAGD